MSELLDGPFDLMTLEQWDALEVAHTRRWELSEGSIIMSPRPQITHQRISRQLIRLLQDHLPDGLEALAEIEVTTIASFPPSVRDPDIVVIRSGMVEGRAARIPAADVVLLIEIVSPGSRRMDTVMKLHEYAKAGIEHYWIVDAEVPDGAWFLQYRLDGDLYRPVATPDGDHVEVHEPVAMAFSLGELTG
ncbi:Uma2 family endonuclease [[Mycobacterium] kokjensenii]|uniref:Uma2 family endonuclease n=1 Tax=[Mycobacterium] kokjensenii TaxID=3064287 RepID=A0ABN9NB22_9MYCO|nr:Uma2 family endonuclease [Mycolicibacter sp. MU0083]CAJ1500595.1 Uma2 family endonuclease [Mycolicibacter sp. MU0083]